MFGMLCLRALIGSLKMFKNAVAFLSRHKLGFNQIIALALVGIIIVGGIYFNILIGQLRKDIAFFQNEAARRDEIHKIDETTISRLTLKVRNIESDNTSLQKTIDLLDGEIRTQASVIATLSDSLADVDTDAGTIVVDGEELRTRTFDVSKDAFQLKGWFQLDAPYNITFQQIAATIALEINMAQLPDGQWEAFVDTKKPNVFVSDLITKTNPYRPSWWQKFNLSAGVYLQGNELGVVGGVGYNKYLMLIGYDPRGYLLGVQYVF